MWKRGMDVVDKYTLKVSTPYAIWRSKYLRTVLKCDHFLVKKDRSFKLNTQNWTSIWMRSKVEINEVDFIGAKRIEHYPTTDAQKSQIEIDWTIEKN